MRLENSFEVDAPVDAAWRLLNDVPAVLPCMPGAELVEVVSGDAWKAKLHVKLGPISMQFLADVSRDVVDETGRRVVLATRAREAKGRGSAEATIESSVSDAGAGTRVDLVTELELRGAVAQYGRPVVAEVAASLTRQFAECLAGKLADVPDASEPRQPERPAPVGGFRLLLTALWRAMRRRSA